MTFLSLYLCFLLFHIKALGSIDDQVKWQGQLITNKVTWPIEKSKNYKAYCRQLKQQGILKTIKMTKPIYDNTFYNPNPIDRWMKGCILPLPKKGDLGLAKNYRGITLSSTAAKIYNAQLRNRIEPKIDNILWKNQNGFRRNRSTTSQILTILRIIEGVRAKNLQATLLFVDFTKAFDSIHRGKMEQILQAYRRPKKNRSSNNNSLQKHQSETTITRWRHRILRHCSRSTTRGHTSLIPLYHLSRLRA